MSENNVNSNNTSDWNDREIGAIWMRTSLKGKKYMTGQITDSFTGEKQKIVIFKNTSKKDEKGNVKNEKAPDFRIYKSEDKAETKENQTQERSQPTKKQETVSVANEDDFGFEDETENKTQTEEEISF